MRDAYRLHQKEKQIKPTEKDKKSIKNIIKTPLELSVQVKGNEQEMKRESRSKTIGGSKPKDKDDDEDE